MPNFDVQAFVSKLDSMGMKLTAVPLADGKVRINRWRMLDAGKHVQQIQELWSTQIGNDQARIDVLASHLANIAPQAAGYSFSPDRLRAGSPSKAATGAEPNTAPDPPKAATPQSDAPVQKQPSVPKQPSAPPAVTASPAAAPQRTVEKAAASSPDDIQIGPELQKLQGLNAAPPRQAAVRRMG